MSLLSVLFRVSVYIDACVEEIMLVELGWKGGKVKMKMFVEDLLRDFGDILVGG